MNQGRRREEQRERRNSRNTPLNQLTEGCAPEGGADTAIWFTLRFCSTLQNLVYQNRSSSVTSQPCKVNCNYHVTSVPFSCFNDFSLKTKTEVFKIFWFHSPSKSCFQKQIFHHNFRIFFG